MVHGLIQRKKKNFTTTHSLNTIKNLSTKQLVDLVLKETNIVLKEGKDYNKRTIAQTRMKVLSILNSPDRTVFNNPDTVIFKCVV